MSFTNWAHRHRHRRRCRFLFRAIENICSRITHKKNGFWLIRFGSVWLLLLLQLLQLLLLADSLAGRVYFMVSVSLTTAMASYWAWQHSNALCRPMYYLFDITGLKALSLSLPHPLLSLIWQWARTGVLLNGIDCGEEFVIVCVCVYAVTYRFLPMTTPTTTTTTITPTRTNKWNEREKKMRSKVVTVNRFW